MNFKPLGDRVMVKPEKNPTASASGLIHLVEHRKPETAGWVTAVGELIPHPEVQPGDYVIFPWSAGQEFLLENDERYIVLRYTDVLAVVEGVSA